ncbi:sensor histidine kinase [Novosphingobium panipatense]
MSRLLFHLSRMVEDLLDVARVSEGKLSLRLERMDLRLILTSAVEGSQHNIQAAGHTLVVDFPAEPIMIEADHTRLAQVVANLLNNAAKYTPSGGKITLSTQVTGRDVEIRVSDNGVGIPEAMLPHIFGMFIQVDGHQARAQGGLGIGLALVRQLVALHGGTIRVESEGEGKGSTFIVTLALSRVV